MKYFILVILICSFISKQIYNQYEFEILYNEKTSNNNNTSNYTAKLKIQEKIFTDYSILLFIILIFGCFITLYGAYYDFFLIIKITLFLYYTISIFFSYAGDNTNRNLLFVLLFSFISGVLIYIVYKSYKETIKKHLIIKKILSGIMTGCFLNQIIFHFILEFNPNFDNNDLYYILFPIFLVLFGVINCFIPEKIISIPCALFSGFFFIQLSMDNFCNFKDKTSKKILDYADLSTSEKILDIVYFIAIIGLAFFFQMYHLKRKTFEEPNFNANKISIKKNIDISYQDVTYHTPNETIELPEKTSDFTEELDPHIDDQDE